ncbi:hypothetical protein FPQ18DRAFT_378468 [Pyronema domesticum]|nr:hypothetical protein FPQ18DRAFT_378468 [Pyronema domesticum]
MSSGTELDQITIAALYWESVATFNRLFDHFKEDSPDTLPNDFGRLKVWAENVAAHRRGFMSLDHRLREASSVKEMVKDLLMNLNSVLEETLVMALEEAQAKGIEQNTAKPETTEANCTEAQTVDSDIDDEIRSTSPLKEAVKEIDNVITCLYRLSITIQSPASQDRLDRMERIDMSHFERFDIEHISNKYHGQLGKDYQYLIQRLGKANTKRRQLLKYHDEHHEKIVGRRVAVGDTASKDVSEDDFFSEAPSNMRTTVSTVYSADVNLVEVTPVDLDSRSQAGFSVTSHASSSANSSSLRVPPPPPGFDKGPFQCPYCYIIVETENRASWKKHVFQDLRPYICTFKDCSQGSHLYKGRHEWFAHESEMHRREWFCSKCKKAFPSSNTFREHLFKKHKHLISDSKEQLEVLIARGARAMEAKQKCPLCQEKYAPMQLRSHLGRHLEQIALFILPEASENEDSGSDHDSDDGNISTAPDMESKTPSLGRRFQGGLLTAQNFLKTGSGINAFDGKGYTPIHKAAQAGNVKRQREAVTPKL